MRALLVDGHIYGASISSSNGDPDVDGSGIVDYPDLEAVAHNWLWRGQAAENAADPDLDGTVDLNDFGVLAGRWLSRKHSVAIFVDSDTYLSLRTNREKGEEAKAFALFGCAIGEDADCEGNSPGAYQAQAET